MTAHCYIDLVEDRAYLFEMIATLAALANGRGEKAIAVMMTAIVVAHR